MSRSRGFTLIELLVALFIAAVMFAMGYGAVNQALRSRDALEEQQAKLLELQTAMRVLSQDFVQLVPRPVRQPVGDGYQPALRADATGQPLVALTRGGWSNPAGLQRPGLQRVAYFFENGTLRREYWTVLDPTLANTTIKRDLIKGLRTVTFRYMDVAHEWRDQWPPTGVPPPTGGVPGGDDSTLRQRPIAVEITFDSDQWGKIVRVVEVAG
jgi:general secretion pathway protein J